MRSPGIGGVLPEMQASPGGVSWKFVEVKCGEIESRQGNKHGKAEALRALLTSLTPYRHDSRPLFDQQILNTHH
jgi:hypothetical protein